jgi:hypothetical protein
MAWLEQHNHTRRKSYFRYAVATAGLFVIGAAVLQLNRMGFRLSLKGM